MSDISLLDKRLVRIRNKRILKLNRRIASPKAWEEKTH